MNQYIRCMCEDCKNYDGDGHCTNQTILINWTVTASGFIPACDDYEEEEDDQ